MDEFLGLVGKYGLLVVDIFPRFVDRQTDGVVLATRNDISWILRIESSEEGDRNINILCDLLKVLSLAGVNSIRDLILDITSGADAMQLGIVHGIASRYIDGKVSSGLFRQERIDAPEVAFSSSAVDGLVDIAWSAVVGSNDEVPILEDGVKVGQEFACRFSGADRVHTFVNERVDLKSVFLACSWHKLP